MHNSSSTITAENYASAWDYTAKLHQKAKKKNMIENLVVRLGNLVFLVLSVVLSYGLLYTKVGGSLGQFLQTLPWLPQAWNSFSAQIPASQYGEVVQWCYHLGAAYLSALAPCIAVAVLVQVIYRTRLREIPGGTDAQNAAALRDLAVEARRYSVSAKHSAATHGIILYFLIMFLMIAVFILRHVDEDGHLGSIESVSQISMAIYAMVLFIGYSLLNYLFQLLLKPLYICNVSKELVADTHKYACSFIENVQAEREAQEIEALYHPKRS